MDEKDDFGKDEVSESDDDSKGDSIIEKVRANPWIVATVILAVVVAVMLVSGLVGITGNVIGGGAIGTNSAENIFLGYLSNAGADVNSVEITDISESNGLYKIAFSYQDEPYPVPYYVTKDGSLIGPMAEVEPQGSQTQTSEVPKSDRPVVELFIWGYCPYGVQAQGPLAEVAELLGDYADFKAVLYYDGHGPFETQENKIQECIQQIAPDKYWAYAIGFVEDIYPKCSTSRDVGCDKAEAIKLMNSLGITSNDVLSCVDSQGESLLSEASARAGELGVSGSPTIVINGVKANPSSRTAEAFKTAVCEAFTEGNVPEACSTTLDSSTAAASGNC